MKFKRLWSCVLALAMMTTMVSFQASAYEGSTDDGEYTIDEPYEYPIEPGTDEWKALKTHEQKLDISQIPEETLHNMTTEALLDTVLNYPLLIDIMAYNSTEKGIVAVSEQFNGLEELLNRDDFSTVATNKMETGIRLQPEAAVNENSIDIDFAFKQLMLGKILSSSTAPMSDYTEGTKKTPNGSRVQVLYYITDISDAEKTIYDTMMEKSYPDAIRLDGATRMYNCHNYAWDDARPYDGWMPDPSAYMKDGSYSNLNGSTLKAGDILYSSDAEHSAVIYSIGGNVQNPITAVSKWGTCGLYRHGLYDCPYGQTSYSQWR
jgi:hypothetical protein